MITKKCKLCEIALVFSVKAFVIQPASCQSMIKVRSYRADKWLIIQDSYFSAILNKEPDNKGFRMFLFAVEDLYLTATTMLMGII